MEVRTWGRCFNSYLWLFFWECFHRTPLCIYSFLFQHFLEHYIHCFLHSNNFFFFQYFKLNPFFPKLLLGSGVCSADLFQSQFLTTLVITDHQFSWTSLNGRPTGQISWAHSSKTWSHLFLSTIKWILRITEWFGLGGTFKIIWFQPPCYKRGHVPLDKIVQRPSSLVLNAYREGASTSKLGNLC